MNKDNKFILFFYAGTCGQFIANILAYYQKSKTFINFDIHTTGHAHNINKNIKNEIIKKDNIISACDFINVWGDEFFCYHLLSSDIKKIKIEHPNKKLLLIEFEEKDVEFITRMCWGKLYKITLTRERYEYCRSLIHNGSTWAEFDNWQQDPIACQHLFEMHKASVMPWLNKIDKSLIDIILTFEDIFNSTRLNQTLANWCGEEPETFIEKYINRYREINKNLYYHNWKL